jgi:predicted small lipoprotein YifL
MRKLLLLPVAALALTGLAACGEKAKNEAVEANEQMPGDSNTMGEAVADVNAAQDAAFNDAEASYTGNVADAAPADGNEIFD